MRDMENLVRIWFGGVREASDAGEKEIPETVRLTPLQRARLRILLRRDACDLLSLCIRKAENISMKEANEIWDSLYSELMEDAIAGIWNEEENLALARYLASCSEGIGDTEDFCSFFISALEGTETGTREEMEAVARHVKERSDKCLDTFIKERQKLQERSGSDDEPPPGMDEFEYIDWVITH